MSSNKLVKRIRYALRWMPDKAYMQLNYFARFHKFINFSNPVTYNEKLNWLKLHDHNPIYTQMVDKCDAKAYIESIVGEGYCIPTIGVWDNFDDIDFDSLPNQFVLKCTHDSEGLVIVKDKSKLDKAAARKKITAALQQNFYLIAREWAYKNVVPRIIAEPYVENSEDGELKDYKFFCFDGVPKLMYIASGRSINRTTFDYYDMEFNHLDIRQKYPNSEVPIKKPSGFEEMIELAKKLSSGFPHLRVDFYEVDGKVYVGELTLYSLGGIQPFHPDKWDRIIGEMLHLSTITID